MSENDATISKENEELCQAAFVLLEKGSNAEALKSLNQVLSLNPVHQRSLWYRAVCFLRLGNMDAALNDLYILLREDPRNLEARNQIRFIHRKLVGSWHIDMMNDTERNLAYQKAIEKAVTKDTTVFEIGTGSGLLSMMAARAGAKHVYTCEKSMPIRKAAQEIIRKNGFAEKITVIDKWSTSVSIPQDIPEKVDLVIGEIFGPGLLEEQALHFFFDAKQRLMKPGAKIIPSKATMYATLIQSEEISKRGTVGKVCGLDLSLFNGLLDDPALQIPLSQFPHKFLSEPLKLKEIEFGVDDIQVSENKVSIKINESGMCHAVAQWFVLETDEQTILDTSSAKPRTHWDQQIQIFEKPFSVTQGSEVDFLLRQFTDRFSLRAVG